MEKAWYHSRDHKQHGVTPTKSGKQKKDLVEDDWYQLRVRRFPRPEAVRRANVLASYLNAYIATKTTGRGSSHPWPAIREAQQREGQAWQVVERSLMHRPAQQLNQLVPSDAARLTALAEKDAAYYIAFAVPEGGGRRATAAVRVPVAAGSIPLRALWDVIEAGGLARVKKCRRPGCEKWFADATYPKNKLGCTDACTWAVNNAKKLQRTRWRQ